MVAPRDGCFAGMCIAAVGKLHHSHYYYSQVVPRYGGVWTGDAEEPSVQYVVVPGDIAAICRGNRTLRKRVQRLLYLQKRLVDESVLTDALAEKRALMPTEIEVRRVVVPAEELRAWREEDRGHLRSVLGDRLEEADRLTKAMEAAGLWELRHELAAAEHHKEAATTAHADTQTPQPKAADEDEQFLEQHSLEYNLPPLCATVREGERKGGDMRSPYDGRGGRGSGGGGGDGTPTSSPSKVAFYGTEQQGFNAELSTQVTLACDGAKHQLSKLVQYTGTLERALAKALEGSSAAMRDFNLQYITAVPEKVTAVSLATEWTLSHPPADIHSFPLTNFGKHLRMLLTQGATGGALLVGALDDVFHALQPVWDCYTGATTTMASDSTVMDLINGHRLAFSDQLGILKEHAVEPLHAKIAATAAEVAELESEREVAHAAKQYATSEACGMGIVDYLEDGLKTYEEAMRGLSAGTADVHAANNNINAFKDRKQRLADRLAAARAKMEEIHNDKDAMKEQEIALIERLAELRSHRKAEEQRIGELMNKNHTRQLDVMKRIGTLQHELQDLCRERTELCAEDVAMIEKAEWDISCVEQRQKVLRDLERWWARLVAHQDETLEMLKSAEGVYDRLIAVIDGKDTCEAQLEALQLDIAREHLDYMQGYLASSTRMLGSYTSRLASLDVHERATHFHMDLAHDALDQTIDGVTDLSAKLIKDRITVQKLVAGLNDRITLRLQMFNERSGIVLLRCNIDFTNPVLTFHEQTEALETRAADALLGHLENEKEAVSRAVVEGVGTSRAPSPVPSPQPMSPVKVEKVDDEHG